MRSKKLSLLSFASKRRDDFLYFTSLNTHSHTHTHIQRETSEVMGGGSSVATGTSVLSSAGKHFFPFDTVTNTTQIPFESHYLTSIEVLGENLIHASVFHFSDHSSTHSGSSGKNGPLINPPFLLNANEYLQKIFFCQNTDLQIPQLCAIQFETNLKRKSISYLFGDNNAKEKEKEKEKEKDRQNFLSIETWQNKQCLLGKETVTNFVHTAQDGYQIVGYQVSPEKGDFGCPGKKNDM